MTHTQTQTLSTLSTHQLQNTHGYRKLWQFIRIALLGYANPLEQYIGTSEPNDCALISKYTHVCDINLCAQPLSIDEISLSAIHIPHPLVKFAKNGELEAELAESPVFVFLHGLGGQMSQFEPLMGLLSQCVEVVALDLPGFGNSRMGPGLRSETPFTKEERERIASSVAKMTWDDFSTDNIVNIVYEFVVQQVPASKKVVLVGHSMGTVLSIKLGNKLPKHKVEGMILLSPPEVGATQNVPHTLKFFTYFPFLFEWFRVWDKLEGIESRSVLRQLADVDAVQGHNLYVKARQFRWNIDVSSPIVLRYIYGFQRASYSELFSAIRNYNDNPADMNVYEKTLVIGADDDKVTPFKIVESIQSTANATFQRKNTASVQVKNAGHSLLLSKPEFISGIILNHLETKFPERLHLSPSWVLQVKAKISGDKWGLKNEMKWKATQPISDKITNRTGDIAPLLAMKTLREDDPVHSPSLVEAHFEKTGERLVAIVDISADIPPYKPTSFREVKYYKCSTVSKVVPDSGAVRRFVQLIDDILETSGGYVGVHCHYGFNRTGFLICCYLIERLGWGVTEAVEGFGRAKRPGIKHRHFVDALYVRYDDSLSLPERSEGSDGSEGVYTEPPSLHERSEGSEGSEGENI